MIAFPEAILSRLAIHHIGNKLQNERFVLSAEPVALDDELLGKLLMQYFAGPYAQVNEIYRLYHPSDDLNLNEVFHFATAIFDDPETFQENSRHLAKHLYESQNHPRIKAGELYITYFNRVQVDGQLHDAIGLFKSENKETYLKVYPQKDGFGLSYEQDAININKLDKGCLIFNTEKEEGYKVAVVDKTNSGQEAVYWKDDFLKLRIRNDAYNQTGNVMGVYKNFVTQKLDDEFELSKADKIDLLNRSMKYFKEKESFDMQEFGREVIGNDEGIASFLNYKKNYEEELETPIPDSFDISDAAVKKQARVYKSVLKLDKNFHIYIHGNKDLIQKGFDDDKAMNYYKVFFKEET